MEEMLNGKQKAVVASARVPKSSGVRRAEKGHRVGLVGWRAGGWHGHARALLLRSALVVSRWSPRRRSPSPPKPPRATISTASARLRCRK